MFLLCYFVLLFIMDASGVHQEDVCKYTSRMCGSNSIQCKCEDYYNIATLCFSVNTTSQLFLVEVSSKEHVEFLIRVFKGSSQSPFRRFQTELMFQISCQLPNLTEGSYTVKIEATTKKINGRCLCGGTMDFWCDNCDVKVNFINYTENWTPFTNTPELPSSAIFIPTTRKPTLKQIPGFLTHVHNTFGLSTLSANTSGTRTDYHGEHPPDHGHPANYTLVAIAVPICIVLVLSLSLFIWKCKGKFGRCFPFGDIHHSSFTTEGPTSRPDSPLTEKSVILSSKLADNTFHENNLDSGFESVSNCKCSILLSTYNGEDADSIFDEKWGAFSIPKPVTFELDHDFQSENSQRHRCIPNRKRMEIVEVPQQRPSAPPDVHFSPPEDQSLALSEEMFRINSAYMKSIISEQNHHLPVIKEGQDGVVRTNYQVCRSTPHNELCQYNPSKTFDILSLGGKSV